MAENVWRLIKPLSTIRAHPSLGIYDCKTIYCFGGYNENLLNIIKTLNTHSEDNEWTTIQLQPAFKSYYPCNGMAIVQNPVNDKLMLFGGCG